MRPSESKEIFLEEPTLAPTRGILWAAAFGLGVWSLAVGLVLMLPQALFLLAGLLTSLTVMVALRGLSARRFSSQDAKTVALRSPSR